MENIAFLNLHAARLLLVILLARLRGQTRMRAGEMRRMAGIGVWRDWVKATKQLEEFGLAQVRKVPGAHEYEFTTNLTSTASVRGKTDRWIDRTNDMIDNLSIYRITDAKAAENDVVDLSLSGLAKNLVLPVPENNLVHDVPNSGDPLENLVRDVPEIQNLVHGVPKNNEYPTYPKNNLVPDVPKKSGAEDFLVRDVPDLKRECIQVDLLDDSGDLSRVGSPAQRRRQAQIPVVQKAWAEFFPTQPTLLSHNAKHFLGNLNNSAEEVYDFFEWLGSLHKDNPLAYGKKVLENRAKQSPPVSSAPQPAFVPGPEPFDHAEAERIDRAAHEQRVKLWRRTHPDGPIPKDL